MFIAFVFLERAKIELGKVGVFLAASQHLQSKNKDGYLGSPKSHGSVRDLTRPSST